jgi:SapC
MSDQPGASDATKNAAAEPGLLFYRNPRPLDAKRHAAKRLRRDGTFAFARSSNSVLLTAGEFAAAAPHFPIVFTMDDPAMPVALLGVTGNTNQLVDASGRWQPNTYIPAYVRRYPFVFMEDAEHKRFTLCIDEGSDWLTDDEGEPLYVDGKPGPVVDQALKFCSDFQNFYAITREFGAALLREKLLIERRAEFRTAAGKQSALSGFRIIDEQALQKLPDATFLDWRKRAWLPLIYSHLFSLTRMGEMFDRAVRAQEDQK